MQLKSISRVLVWRLSTILALTLAINVVGVMVSRGGSALAGSSSLVHGVPNDARRIELTGHIQPLAQPRYEAGAVPGAMPMAELKLDLRRSAAQELALQKLLDAQQTPGSAQYRKWLTPAQFGTQFGPSDADLQAARAWLESHAFKVADAPAGRGFLPFSGTAAQVEAAFETSIHYFKVDGVQHFANLTNPQIPVAFQSLIRGVRGLHDFRAKSRATSRMVSEPNLLAGGGNYVGPLDFATMYDVAPLVLNGVRGDGVTVAVAAQSDIDLSIPYNYWTAFGVILEQQVSSVAAAAATDPGRTANEDESEAYLDVEIIGVVAPDAKILVVRDKDVGTAFEYAINHNLAGIINISFSTCEQSLGSANASVNAAFQQAVAQGITVVVSSGDNGIAECEVSSTNSQGQTVISGLSVNGFASTPYDIAVGATDLNPLLEPQGNYWNSSNSAMFFSNAESYIPEMVWNGSCANPVFATLYNESSSLALCNDSNHAASLLRISGSGGGFSSCISVSASGACSTGYAVPSWQAGVVGIQGLTSRAIPDVAMLGSKWVACDQTVNPCAATGHPIQIFGGTSAAAPGVSGMIALLDEALITTANTEGRVGNFNPTLYKLATQEYGSPTSPNAASLSSCNANNGASVPASCLFNDITTGGNAQPCKVGTYAAPNSRPLSQCVSAAGDTYGIVQAGSSSAATYAAGPGYDLASGLGSINAAILVEWVTGKTAPLKLVASGSGTSATLTWTAVVGASGYNIYGGFSSGSESHIPVLAAVTGTSAVVNGLQPGAIYYFTVTGILNSGETYPCTEQAVVLVPATPTGVTAVGTASNVSLSWGASVGATTYNVLAGSTAGGEASTPVATGLTDTSYTAATTVGEVSYFKVVAVNQGGSSAASSEVSGTVLPIAPTGLTATGGNASVTLHWVAGAGASSYDIYDSAAGQAAATAVMTNVTSSMATVSGLINGTSYSFYVTSVNSAGASQPSSSVSAAPIEPAGHSGGGALGLIDLLLACVLVLGRRVWSPS